MKTMLRLAVMVVLIAASPKICFALWLIEPIADERAKELGMEIRTTAGGANQVRVELEYPLDGELKDFSRVDLRVGQGNNPPVTAPLREDRSKPGRVVVSFNADRAELAKLSLWVYVPESLGGSIYAVRVADFMAPSKP